MKEKFYAIKIGKNVKDKIVSTWEECESYVIGYPSIYKSFKNKKEANKYLQSFSEEQVQERLMWQEIQRRYRLRKKIQDKFNFNIVDYILDAIINNENYNTKCSLINLAILNNRISKKNANKLIKYIETL